MLKNTGSQKWRVFAFNRSTNEPVTGDAANITANIKIDYGASAAVADTNPTEDEDGYYLFDLTQAETNGDHLAIAPESSTTGVQVIGDPPSITTAERQSTVLSAIAGLNTFTITRVGPGWNAATQEITLTQADDYSASKGRAITFDLDALGFSVVGATARVRATRAYKDPIVGTATILDPSGSPQLQLEWTREQLKGDPGEYQWDAEIIDSDGEVATMFSGVLTLIESRTTIEG